MLAGIESVTSACQYQTLIANYEYDAEREEREVLNLLSYNIDGLILTGKLHTERMIQYVRASGVPVAELMDISGQYLDIQVGFDNEKAAFEMTRAFIDSGKRHIAFFGSMDDPRDLSRYRGTENALAAQGLEAYHPAPKTISSVALGRKMFQQAMAEKPDIDAIFCTNDDGGWRAAGVSGTAVRCAGKNGDCRFPRAGNWPCAAAKNRQRDYTTL